METKGITIEFYGKTVELEDSIKDINKGLRLTKAEVSDLNKNLKLDPTNIELLEKKLKGLRQEQTLLTEKVKYFEDEISKLGKEDVGTDKWTGYQKELGKAQAELAKVTDLIAKQEKINDQNTESIKDSANATKQMKEGFEGAGQGAIRFGDLVKANVISQAIISGIKTLARELKDLAGDLHEWADSYRELEVYERQFETNLRNTADATDEQIASLKKLAKQKQRNGVISAKAITSAYQELATYVEEADSIEGLTDALTDMAAQQYGVDATDEAVRNLATTLGKALANGDYSGLTRLGYGFDEAQQKIMKYGTEAERVAVLNDVIASSIGGVNEALAQTDAGKIFQMQQYFDDVKESIGEVISELEVGFIEQIMPQLQPFIDGVLKWIIDHKEDMINMVSDIVAWLTSDETKQFFSDVAELVKDFAEVLTDVILIGDKIGLWEGIFNTVKGIITGIKELFDAIAEDVASIKAGGLGSWMQGNYNSYYPGTFESGGFSSGGMMSGSITLNNSFTINNGNNITEGMLKNWADIMTEQINENLGRMV